MAAIIVWTTMPDVPSARKLAAQLITQKLAACVSVTGGVVSMYRWKGKVRRSREALLSIKTSRSHWNALQKFILNKHPYELPELIALPVLLGSKKYLGWVEESLKFLGL